MAEGRYFYEKIKSENNKPKATAFHDRSDGGGGTHRHLFSTGFNGEKNVGEMGPPKDYVIDHNELRLRSWQSFLESNITQMIMKKSQRWTIGTGLRPQSEPVKEVLESEGITLDDKLSKTIESRFILFSKSKKSSYSGMQSLNKQGKVAFKNAKVGGDVLTILRLVKGQLKVELIDGARLGNHEHRTGIQPIKLDNGNWLWHGVEINDKMEHIAYHVIQNDRESTRIKARTKDGFIQAYLTYGFEYRLHNVRGLPLFSVVLEKLKVLERYETAVVGSAEERQKIFLAIEHGMHSTGTNPMFDRMLQGQDVGGDHDSGISTDAQGQQIADKFTASTNRTMLNMPNDSRLSVLDPKNELSFKEFFDTNIDIIAASLDIPPDVAKSMYNSNFSASRAALKDWEFTLIVERDDFREQWYQPIYEYWLHVQILQNKIQAQGYLTSNQDSEIRQAYVNARFVGPGVPHIDPVKEVKAEREKLGSSSAHIPLTSFEKSVENLNEGDWSQNISNFAREQAEAEKLGIKKEEPAEPAPSTNNTNNDD